jgi:hypothetical protein
MAELTEVRLQTAGHSCGGLEALSTAYHDDRVKRILPFDISIFEDDKRYLFHAIDVPVACYLPLAASSWVYLYAVWPKD